MGGSIGTPAGATAATAGAANKNGDKRRSAQRVNSLSPTPWDDTQDICNLLLARFTPFALHLTHAALSHIVTLIIVSSCPIVMLHALNLRQVRIASSGVWAAIKYGAHAAGMYCKVGTSTNTSCPTASPSSAINSSPGTATLGFVGPSPYHASNSAVLGADSSRTARACRSDILSGSLTRGGSWFSSTSPRKP